MVSATIRAQLGTLSKPKKKNIINDLTAKFDDEHTESVLAAYLESKGAANIIIQRMSAKVGAVEKKRSVSRVRPLELRQKALRRRSPRLRLTMSLARFGCTRLS